MESIRKYIAKFLENHEQNIRFNMKANECASVIEMARNGKPVEAVYTVFRFGYAKGYRAAMAEMRKGGAASCR